MPEVFLLLFEKDVFEGPAEVLVEDGVDDRVEGAIAVPNPEEEFEESLRDRTRISTNAVEAITEEEGEPAHHKDPHDHCQHKSEAFLPGLSDLLAADAAALPAAVGREEVHGATAGAGQAAGVLGGVGAGEGLALAALAGVLFPAPSPPALRGAALLQLNVLQLGGLAPLVH